MCCFSFVAAWCRLALAMQLLARPAWRSCLAQVPIASLSASMQWISKGVGVSFGLCSVGRFRNCAYHTVSEACARKLRTCVQFSLPLLLVCLPSALRSLCYWPHTDRYRVFHAWLGMLGSFVLQLECAVCMSSPPCLFPSVWAL